MEGEAPIWILIGLFGLICGIGLAFVEVDKGALEKNRHSFPGLSLFRFRLWRWLGVAVCLVFGVFFIATGLGWVGM